MHSAYKTGQKGLKVPDSIKRKKEMDSGSTVGISYRFFGELNSDSNPILGYY